MRHLLFALIVALVLTPGVTAAGDAETQPTAGKPTLVVVDIQNAYLPHMDDVGKEKALYFVNYAIHLFRERGLPIIVVYHTDLERGPAPGTEPFEFADVIEIQDGDPKVTKHHPSAFQETNLEQLLHEQGSDTVFLVGLSAVGCVLHTYFDASRLGFRTFMVEGALLSHDSELTRNVETITDTVDLSTLDYIVEIAPR